MKLIDKEPTQEMITAMSRTYTSLKEMFRAAYDTAPAMEQEPFGYVREIRPMEWKFSKTTSWGPEVWKPVFTFPIDAQAEIAKRDARIEELEADQVKAQAAVKIGNYIGRTYLIAWCDSALADQVIDLLKEQAAEISRLKGVIAKYQTLEKTAYVLLSRTADDGCFLTHKELDVFKEALAAVKEERL